MAARDRILVASSLVLLLGGAAALSSAPLGLQRRAFLGGGAAAAIAAPGAAHAALGPPLFDTTVAKIDLSEEELEKLLGGYGRAEIEVVYAPNNARLNITENEANEMQRLGFLVVDAKKQEQSLRTFTPRYWFPTEPGENWYAPPFRRLSFEFTESNKARKEKCFAVSDALRKRVDAKVALVSGLAPPAGYVAPEPEDPTMCGDERFGRFKCAEIEKPGAYLKKAQGRLMTT